MLLNGSFAYFPLCCCRLRFTVTSRKDMPIPSSLGSSEDMLALLSGGVQILTQCPDATHEISH